MKDVIDRNRRFLVREPSRNPKLFPASANTDDGLALDDDLLQSLEGVESSENMECDAAFFECVVIKECASCFDQMQMNSVDWAGVTQNTECDTVVTTLQKNNLCKSLGPNNKDKFCDTFKSCVEFDDKESKGKEDTLDCSALTKCDWPGIHSSFVGDGVCQDAYFNTCYNTAICGFDKGDCCKDTCKEPRHGYTECGSDGYACRDPLSKNCDPTLTLSCPSSSYENTDDSHRPLPVCTSDQSLYRIDMFDTFGDGWGETAITITASSGASKGQALTPIYQGGLKNGAEGNDYFCLSLNPSCYHVNMSGGVWGRESSWYIQGYAKGSPPVASGGGSMSCEFGVAGGSCNNTCTGASNHAPGQNPQYRDFKNMVNCIEEKCMLQVSACNSDQACANCYAEEIRKWTATVGAAPDIPATLVLTFSTVSGC
jgi:hypothetical protein